MKDMSGHESCITRLKIKRMYFAKKKKMGLFSDMADLLSKFKRPSDRSALHQKESLEDVVDTALGIHEKFELKDQRYHADTSRRHSLPLLKKASVVLTRLIHKSASFGTDGIKEAVSEETKPKNHISVTSSNSKRDSDLEDLKSSKARAISFMQKMNDKNRLEDQDWHESVRASATALMDISNRIDKRLSNPNLVVQRFEMCKP